MKQVTQWFEDTFTPENLAKWLTHLGGRRFILTMIAGLTTSVLVWYGRITPEIYRDVIIGTVGIYIAGNTMQKNVETKTTGGPSSGGP